MLRQAYVVPIFLKKMTKVNSAARNVFIFHYTPFVWAIDDSTLNKK
jgi:hypothetical protein